MTLTLRRMGWGMILLLIAVGFAFASMVRIVPNDAAEAPVLAPSHVPAAPPEATQAAHPLLTVPVEGVRRSQIRDTWGETRANGARTHQASDIMAPGGARVVAAAPGTVEKLYYSNGGGGITLYVRSPDRLWSYYYAHLQSYAPGVHEGMKVAAGDLLGFVGDTGNAGVGNFHLHFAVAMMRREEGWWQGTPVNPYPLLAGAPGGG
jgi:murein DD-endopeptidase MepM/ murein hydrolase activator NlpD